MIVYTTIRLIEKGCEMKLRVKAERKTYCPVCGGKVVRKKVITMNVDESSIEDAKKDMTEKVNSWNLTEKQKHCSVCWSILNSK